MLVLNYSCWGGLLPLPLPSTWYLPTVWAQQSMISLLQIISLFTQMDDQVLYLKLQPTKRISPHHSFSRTLLHGAVVQPISSVAHSNELTHPRTIPTLPNLTIINFTLSLPPASTIPEFYYSHCH